jgi:hypothetical protein
MAAQHSTSKPITTSSSAAPSQPSPKPAKPQASSSPVRSSGACGPRAPLDVDPVRQVLRVAGAVVVVLRGLAAGALGALCCSLPAGVGRGAAACERAGVLMSGVQARGAEFTGLTCVDSLGGHSSAAVVQQVQAVAGGRAQAAACAASRTCAVPGTGPGQTPPLRSARGVTGVRPSPAIAPHLPRLAHASLGSVADDAHQPVVAGQVCAL